MPSGSHPGVRRLALSEAGIDSSSYSGHSFHIGAATTAGRNGVSSEKINRKMGERGLLTICTTVQRIVLDLRTD